METQRKDAKNLLYSIRLLTMLMKKFPKNSCTKNGIFFDMYMMLYMTIKLCKVSYHKEIARQQQHLLGQTYDHT